MAKTLTLLFTMCFLYGKSNSFIINPQKSKFPKMTYNKIYDISYRKSIYISQKKPYILMLFKQINKTLSTFVNDYIDEVYAMGSFPLSFITINKLNETNDNINI